MPETTGDSVGFTPRVGAGSLVGARIGFTFLEGALVGFLVGRFTGGLVRLYGGEAVGSGKDN